MWVIVHAVRNLLRASELWSYEIGSRRYMVNGLQCLGVMNIGCVTLTAFSDDLSRQTLRNYLE